VLFGWLLVRAWLLPGRLAGPGRLAPRQVGRGQVRLTGVRYG
jgi:hypothetical protein